MPAKSIPTKIASKLANKAFNTASSKILNKAANKLMDLLGMGKPEAPKKLMPHELQALLEDSDDTFSLDTFSGRLLWNGALANDITLTRLKSELCAKHNLRLTKTDLREAVQLACHSNPVSPVAQYLQSLEWDGVDRLGTLLGLLNPIVDDEEHRALCQRMLTCFLVASVARALEPGIKADDVLVLVGKQRAGKSTLLRELASSQWFRDSQFDIEARDGLQCMQGCWVYEMSELKQILKKDPATTKSFLSSQSDTYRQPWAKTPESFPRSTIFAATTNQKRFLNDSTGSSRFHIIEVGTIDLAGLVPIRSQIWAQAVALRNRGVNHWLDTADTAKSEAINTRYTVESAKASPPAVV